MTVPDETVPDEFDFHGLDAERPLPPGLRERLEAALLAAAAGPASPPGPGDAPAVAGEGVPDPDAGLFTALDAPRLLGPEQTSRMEAAVLAAASAAPAGVANPDELAARRGVVVGLRRVWPAMLSVAAVIALLFGSVAVLGGGDDGREVTAAPPRPTTTTDIDGDESTEAPAPTIAPPAVPEATAKAPASGAPAAAATRPGAPAPPKAPATTPAKSAAPAGGSSESDESGSAGARSAPAPAGGPSPAASEGGASAAPAPAAASSGSGGVGPNSGSGSPPPYAFGGGGQAENSTASSDSRFAPGPDREPAPARPAPENPGPPAPEGDQAKAAPAYRGPALRVGVVGGDAAQEAGFRGYVDAVNAAGGIDGRPLEIVPVSPGTAAQGTIVTVNLSDRVLANASGAPAWVTGALLETLTAPAAVQPAGGSVRSFASPPERQARLAADTLFPADARGATAVVFTSDREPWKTLVPDAIEAVLGPRGVQVERAPYDPDRPPAILPMADAAFLSLDTASAQGWLRHAKVTAYAPARGVAGVSSLYDETLLPDMADGVKVLSPYVVPAGPEGEALRAAVGQPSARSLHGWATAKMLSVALWHTGADQAEAVEAAVGGLGGYDPGLFPPYQTREGTNSRTPDAVLFEVRGGAFVPQGGFRRDPS